MFALLSDVCSVSYWQRWLELQTINQMKNVLLVSKVFCICVRAGFIYAMGHLDFNISLRKF